MKLFLTSSLLFITGVASSNTNHKIISCSRDYKDTASPNHILKSRHYRSKQIKSIIAYNTNGQKDSISNYYDKSGNINSTKTYSNGKLEGNVIKYFPDRTEVQLYKNNKAVCFSVYDPNNVLEYQMPIDTAQIKGVKILMLSGRNYFDKDKADTLLLVTPSIPRENRSLFISGGCMIYRTDSTREIRATETTKSDSIIISIRIGYDYNKKYRSDKIITYKTIRLIKK